MKRKNSCVKGKAGERDAAAFLRSIGFTLSQRNGRNGYKGGDDLRVPELPNLRLEVKRNESITLGSALLQEAMDQCDADCEGTQRPVVLWRRNRTCWRITVWTTNEPETLATFDRDHAEVLRALNREVSITPTRAAVAGAKA